MKKAIAFFLSFSFLFALLLSALPTSIFAEDIPFDANYSSAGKSAPSLTDTYVDAIDRRDGEEDEPERKEPERDFIPDDRFDGEYSAFPAKDGSVTTVYDNGSVVTVYPDGSREGVDYVGNRYTEDRDGRQVVYTTDGNLYIKNADGSEEAVSKNGTHTYFNKDGSYYTVTKTGTVFEYDQNDEFVAVSIEGGERLEILDKDGNLITGEHVITGPDGKKFTFINRENDDGSSDRFTMWSEGNGKEFGIDCKSGDGDEDYEIVYQPVDRLRVDMSYWEKDGDESGSAEFKMKITDLTDGSFLGIRGTFKYDQNSGEMEIVGENEEGEFCNVNMKGDSDGNAVMTIKTEEGTTTFVANENETSLTFPDGSFLKTDPNSDAAELFIPSDGTHIKINEKGEVEVYEIPGDDGSSLRYEDGKFVVRDEHGEVVSVIETNKETGETTVTNADGDTYTVTKDGRVLKNGKELKPEETGGAEHSTTADKIVPISELIGTWYSEGTAYGLRVRSDSDGWTISYFNKTEYYRAESDAAYNSTSGELTMTNSDGVQGSFTIRGIDAKTIYVKEDDVILIRQPD
ncbi:MAG: hypothetical protein IKZ41_09755 [Clostridia bacterium]|nr:hypothetical protein [Clostridia bacterium]